MNNEHFRKLLLSFPAKAIEFLYQEYYQSLLVISINLTHNRKASEDIVQETFIHVWRNYQWIGQHHEKSIQHYLVRVVKNKSITSYRNALREQLMLDEYPRDQVQHPADQALISYERHDTLRKFITTFPQREQQCMFMRIDEELSVPQMADRLGVSRKAVERCLTSANKRIRNFLRQQAWI